MNQTSETTTNHSLQAKQAMADALKAKFNELNNLITEAKEIGLSVTAQTYITGKNAPNQLNYLIFENINY